MAGLLCLESVSENDSNDAVVFDAMLESCEEQVCSDDL